ncbi:beta-lactamase-like protein [Xylaria sp. CBS 124048]|nr:beta-lactamase-like protein [Xylaria sp. CBS 124048]
MPVEKGLMYIYIYDGTIPLRVFEIWRGNNIRQSIFIHQVGQFDPLGVNIRQLIFLTMATPLDLHIPSSTSTVNVSIIHTGTILKAMPTGVLLEPQIPGHEYLYVPCYSFLIQHPTQDRTLVFDLGIRKDWQNWPEPVRQSIIENDVIADVPKDVREMLDEHGVDTKKIEAVIWSHSHLDHIGNPSIFEASTRLLVGKGTKEDVFPGYPTNPKAGFKESDVAGRIVEEIDFSTSKIKVGGLAALDYFGDGSFYLLDTPGHCIGHMCALARVTSSPDSFILMGGDAVHHGGELRPHPWHPLPESILPNPFHPTSHSPCPGELFGKLLPNGREAPFYRPSSMPYSPHADIPTTIETIKRLQEADAHSNILIVAAHDASFLNVAEFFPASANAFMEKGWAEKVRWAWLADYATAVGMDENIPRTLFGDPRPLKNRV